MSDMNIETDINNKNCEIIAVNNRDETISESLWITGVSKTHPGLKYYFNTVTGVSVWNISREDMERAKHTIKSQQNQSFYKNCPEPKDPPPGTRLATNKPTQTHCKHNMHQHSKNCIKQHLNCETPAFSCDVCYSPVNSSPNVITVNFSSCPHPTYSSEMDNVCNTPSQTQSTSTLLGTPSTEKNHSNGPHNFFDSQTPVSKSSSESHGMVKECPSSETLPIQSNVDSEFFKQNTIHFETLDLTPLKMFARIDVIQDIWYIIADAHVYLHDFKLLKSVVDADKQCSLMVPRNVRIELENAIKTELRTKAHCASYFIYKMFDLKRALIDEDSSENINDKSNEEHILECCSRLRDQNFYVVVISNDIDLQKYRNKIYIPIFTVSEIKEYLYKNNNFSTAKTPQSKLNFSSSSINKVPTAKSNSDMKLDKNIQTSNEIGETSRGMSKMVDAEVQTSLQCMQLEKIEEAYKNKCWPNQNSDISIGKECLNTNNQLLETSRNNKDSGPGKRIILRRRRMFNQTVKSLATNETEMSAKMTSNNNNNKNLNELKHTDDNIKPNETKTQHVMVLNIEENHSTPNSSLKPVEDKSIIESKLRKDNVENKNVMFEVTSQMMNENLRTRCDEWLSRFVQIMEEGLTQVLRRKSALPLPPPWNMYEAATCVEKIFHNDEDVADASKKFLNILISICDKKGNINSNITPRQFMEMYSYGVYMIDALQGILSTCEDLQIAAEYLSKLLNDIQNPETDITNLEREETVDNINSDDKVEVLMIVETQDIDDEKGENNDYEPSLSDAVPSKNVASIDNNERFKDLNHLKITITNNHFNNQNLREENSECYNKSQEDSNRINTEAKKISNMDAITSPSRYNLRLKTITTSPLQKNILVENSCNRLDNLEKNITPQNVNDNVVSSGCLETGAGNSGQLSYHTTDVLHENTTSNEPNIVRNFVVSSELKNRLKTRRVHDEMDKFGLDFVAPGYVDDEVSSGGTGRLQIDEFPEYKNDVDEYQEMEQQETISMECDKLDFKYFVRRIADEIKDLSWEVYTFSRNCCADFNSISTTEDKMRIRRKAEKTHLCIDKICAALTKILNRDKNGGHNIQTLLRHNDIDDISVDEEQLELYGSFIARCLEHACELKNNIEKVLAVVC